MEIGIITAVHRERYEVMVENRICFAQLKAGIYYRENTQEDFPTVGDKVELYINPNGDGQIKRTLPRKSCFKRKNPTIGMPEQIVAANFDYVFILMSLNQDFNINRLERYIAISWQSGGIPVVILTKSDLCTEGAQPSKEEMLQKVYKVAIGVDVHVISTVTKEGIQELNSYLQHGKQIVFLGSSGVGKSTLVNELSGEEWMDTGEIRENDSRGKHTTTWRQMIWLPCGAAIIDTPGMRELGMSDASKGIGQTFEDIESLILSCRFPNCTHQAESGCAVKSALKDGSLTEKRWKNYQKLMAETLHAKRREKFLEKQRIKKLKKAKGTAPRKKEYRDDF